MYKKLGPFSGQIGEDLVQGWAILRGLAGVGQHQPTFTVYIQYNRVRRFSQIENGTRVYCITVAVCKIYKINLLYAYFDDF